MKREVGEKRQTGRKMEKWSIKLQNRERTEYRLRRKQCVKTEKRKHRASARRFRELSDVTVCYYFNPTVNTRSV